MALRGIALPAQGQPRDEGTGGTCVSGQRAGRTQVDDS
jgi:hypothetical protein